MTVAIGQKLKEARTQKSVTLEDVHAKIKIHPRVLQLLEEEKFDKLPSPLFVKSFLKSYAEFLELNPEEIVGAYEKQNGRKEPEQQLFIESAAQQNKSMRFNRDYVLVPLFLAAVGVLLFIGYDLVKTVIHWSAKEKKISAKAHGLKAAPAAGSAKERGGSAVSSGGEWLRSVELGNFPKLGRRVPLELQIKALDDVWMRVTCDGKVLFESILKRGAVESWNAENKIEIWTGNSSNMALALNRYVLGSPGKGVVKKMVLNHDGVKIVAS